MKKSRIAIIGAIAAGSLALFGWGAVAGAGQGMTGVIAGEGDAVIIASDQPDAKDSVVIDKVVAPTDAFVVVHQSDGGMPGKRVGYISVKEGVSRDVRVTLDPEVPLTPELLAAVHIDKGTKGELEFDMEDMENSPDRPFYVDGKEVAAAFKAAPFGVPASMDEGSIEVGDQGLGSSVTIDEAIAPADAFVVVHAAKADGMPGERLGYASIKAGTTSDVKVELKEELTKRTKLIAAVHADRGELGSLEFDMEKPVDSPDQPFFVDGMELASVFEVGTWGVPVDSASIEATDQVDAAGTITIDRVDAPSGSWVVVHKDAGGKPGDRVGLKYVKSGESRDVKVELTTDMLPENLIVAVHADRDVKERFDFDMMDKLDSADQPYFVDGAEVAQVIKVRTLGYPTPSRTAAIVANDQVVKEALLEVERALAPEPSWIVVHLDAGGMPGARVGLAHIDSGETRNALVQLDASKMLTDRLFVAVHADRGEAEQFEFDMVDKVNSPDQPFFVDGGEVATAVNTR